MKLNVKNQPTRLIAIGVGSVLLAVILWLLGYDFQRTVAAVPYVLLFLILIKGPLVRIWPALIRKFSPGFPITWRSEMGIWFAIWSVVHILFVFSARDWDVIGYMIDMSPWAFGAFVATFIAIVLAITSNQKALKFLGVDAWKWHQSHGTYLIFWLAVVHVYDRAYRRPFRDVGFPSNDPIHWVYIIMTLIVIVLHVAAFFKIVGEYRKTGKYPKGL